MRPLARNWVKREAQVQEKQHGRKTVSKRSFDTGPCPVEIPRTSHMRSRRVTEISVVVRGLPKIKKILNKRPTPAEMEFRILGLCKCVFDGISV